jgi:hypothetical protein
MSYCSRNILLIFGSLIFLALLIVPYRSTRVAYKMDPYSKINYKIIKRASGHMLVLNYVRLKSTGNSSVENNNVSYYIDKDLFITEIVVILLVAFLDYFLFCRASKKGEGK